MTSRVIRIVNAFWYFFVLLVIQNQCGCWCSRSLKNRQHFSSVSTYLFQIHIVLLRFSVLKPIHGFNQHLCLNLAPLWTFVSVMPFVKQNCRIWYEPHNLFWIVGLIWVLVASRPLFPFHYYNVCINPSGVLILIQCYCSTFMFLGTNG